MAAPFVVPKGPAKEFIEEQELKAFYKRYWLESG